MKKYQVYVGNIGMVYDGSDEAIAESKFQEYKKQSESNYGRAGGEDVTMMKNGEIFKEYVGTLSQNATN